MKLQVFDADVSSRTKNDIHSNYGLMDLHLLDFSFNGQNLLQLILYVSV